LIADPSLTNSEAFIKCWLGTELAW